MNQRSAGPLWFAFMGMSVGLVIGALLGSAWAMRVGLWSISGNCPVSNAAIIIGGRMACVSPGLVFDADAARRMLQQ